MQEKGKGGMKDSIYSFSEISYPVQFFLLPPMVNYFNG